MRVKLREREEERGGKRERKERRRREERKEERKKGMKEGKCMSDPGQILTFFDPTQRHAELNGWKRGRAAPKASWYALQQRNVVCILRYEGVNTPKLDVKQW
uniref:Uncharacterized protein n=1 Tax=Octopus bimaculoides TaxID=37653 RepID=A0A0L8FUA3_OCTBM